MASGLTMSIRDQAYLWSSLWLRATSVAGGASRVSTKHQELQWAVTAEEKEDKEAQRRISGNGIGGFFAPLAIRDLWHWDAIECIAFALRICCMRPEEKAEVTTPTPTRFHSSTTLYVTLRRVGTTARAGYVSKS